MLSFLIAVAVKAPAEPPLVVPTPGMVITRSVRLKPGTYLLRNTERLPGLTIRGKGITVDFNGAIIRGTPETVEPDQRTGTGIVVEGSDVLIRGAKVHGYQVGLLARNVPNLRIVHSDFSWNWKQRLKSTPEKEDLADWMSFHKNEADEWLRYGAALYLSGCDGFEVKGVTAQGGQCGLMLTRSNRGLVWNSDFSFLSAIGIGMHRSSDNRILHNRIDYCLRGFSWGKYNRGQDSSGILIYEQSHRNVFAYNSVTHGGDGFFLWAGQTTMDTGQGGCNDNLLYGNDFSHAPTNGIEATFSRNVFANNLVMECWHGVWGGYSYGTQILGNVFAYNSEAIAIEHGQSNRIAGNVFFRDAQGVRLWANPEQDPNWGYPKHRETRSRDIRIEGNEFRALNPGPILNVRATEGVQEVANRFGALKALPGAAALTDGDGIFDANEYFARFQHDWNPLARRAGGRISVGTDPAGQNLLALSPEVLKLAPKPMGGGMNPFLKPEQRRGWRTMIVDEWGPYDFRSPRLVLRSDLPARPYEKIEGAQPQRFETWGPSGRWRVKRSAGYRGVSPQEGWIGDVVTAVPDPASVGDQKLELEYVGEATTDHRGIVTPAGRPVGFGFERFEVPIDWTVSFFRWTVSQDAKDVHAAPAEAKLRAILNGPPVKQVKPARLEYAGYAFDPEVGAKNFATVAEGTFRIAPGEYVLEITTDDGARVWLDGKPIVEDAWKYQGPTAYERRVRLGGEHRLRLEHFQIDGYAALQVRIRRG